MSAAVEILLEALHAEPSDETAWLALADALEESGQSERAELTRLLRRRSAEAEPRVQALLASGVRPCLPERTRSLGMRFVLVPAGTFLMGSPDGEEGRSADEGPVHEVEISRPFYLGVTPVTQEQFRQVMGSNPSWASRRGGGSGQVRWLSTGSFPVESVTWDEAMAFCRKLSEAEGDRQQGWGFTLPTEAQWEHACRAGAPSCRPFHCGDSLSPHQANFDAAPALPAGTLADVVPAQKRPCPVGSYPGNAWGLYDMHGNVWEWCNDWYGPDYSRVGPRRDPPGRASGYLRVIRGGGWGNRAGRCRSAARSAREPGRRHANVGFRVALVRLDGREGVAPAGGASA
jgi:uncharacterized protein (TIGR02996 family)